MGQSWMFFRYALRKVLSYYTGVSADRLRFNSGPHGKPELAYEEDDAPLYFNLSHSGELALVAVTRIAPIGVDLEWSRAFPNMDGVARSCFSSSEYATWSQFSAEQRVRGFYHCWTRKEAVIKAVGLGLSAPLDAFDVPLETIDDWCWTNLRPPLKGKYEYPLAQVDAGKEYIAAVSLCVPGHAAFDPPRITLQRFHPQ